MELLIALVTLEDQVVLDPFCGCGTTLVAAKRQNRQYLGMEQNENYYQNTLRRLEETKRV